MEFARFAGKAFAWASLVTLAALLGPVTGAAGEGQATVRFQKPSRGATPAATNSGLEFRRSSSAEAAATAPVAIDALPTSAGVAPQAADALSGEISASAARQASYDDAKPLATARPKVIRTAPAQKVAMRPTFTEPSEASSESVSDRRFANANRHAEVAHGEPWYGEEGGPNGVTQTGYCDVCDDCCEPACGIGEAACGICEPACGCNEPTCGICEPACGLMEPGCGLVEPDCGLVDPSCGCDDVGCGSCIGNPGPDYWCFPVCLPRLKEFSVWAGVHGFKGPRDVFDGGTDGNFGFQEGLNIGGRAPLVGLLFPQLSYQLGYQAVQSRLSGSSGGVAPSEERNQDFITAGLFRRVPAGVQFGAVFDWMNDDLNVEEDFHQIRYEISVKSQHGREIGFWGASATNNEVVGGHDLQAVGQYALFFRWHFRDAGEARFWGGGTDDNEGLFGADFYVPFNNRWSLNTGFNYLITDEPNGALGAQEESWNVGMNLVWHYGRTAKHSRLNPHRPLFSVADNGSMFIDQRP